MDAKMDGRTKLVYVSKKTSCKRETKVGRSEKPPSQIIKVVYFYYEHSFCSNIRKVPLSFLA